METEDYLKKKKEPVTSKQLAEEIIKEEHISMENAKKRISREKKSSEIPSFQSVQNTEKGDNYPVSWMIPPRYLGNLIINCSGNMITLDYSSGGRVYPIGSLLVNSIKIDKEAEKKIKNFSAGCEPQEN